MKFIFQTIVGVWINEMLYRITSMMADSDSADLGAPIHRRTMGDGACYEGGAVSCKVEGGRVE